jgi:glutamate dehydrogenase (NADP+)
VWSGTDAIEIIIASHTHSVFFVQSESAKRLVRNGVLGVLEGANLPTNLQAQLVFRSSSPGVIYVPGKASNAGGVGVSGMEMSQNAMHLTWTRDEVDAKLQDMMASIYASMEASEAHGGSLEQGANLAGFLKVAIGMKELGWIY